MRYGGKYVCFWRLADVQPTASRGLVPVEKRTCPNQRVKRYLAHSTGSCSKPAISEAGSPPSPAGLVIFACGNVPKPR